MSRWGTCRFNSLQTGTRIQSPGYRQSPDESEGLEFQFPSNGNADTKLPWRSDWWRRWSCFNSLQTGTRIQRLENRTTYAIIKKVSIPFKRERGYKAFCLLSLAGPADLFQFPSNGNADTKQDRDRLLFVDEYSFNSLQTGKQIQSLLLWIRRIVLILPRVSIPFKRERGYKALGT